ncbi:Lar family restriction alleviation protein [Pseudomonas putida]|uniref:Restriction alleviation protein, Lar family n=1 Tax=Pseudomonas putida TaxID=303 RepID=A0AAW5HM67_PSEPU|nr:Lar family restriction alleviation protein [Pseudomonas putida]MCO1622205.1 hypothetical protein [Pseudomonas putida]
MPTEYRPSNTEMAAKLSPCPFCGQQDAFVEQLDSDASVVICQGRIDEHSACLARGPVGVQQHECEDQPGRDQAVKEWNKRAAAQNHPEPIAWMVGTAFWWTKEEAERDAAETGLPIVWLGPMPCAAPGEQLHGEPVALPSRLPVRMPQGRNLPRNYAEAWNACLTEIEKLGPLYTHADPGEVERLQLEIEKLRLSLTLNDDALIQDGFVRIENRALRSRIDEQHELLREIKNARDWNGSYRALEKRIDAALSASAEPSALSDALDCKQCAHPDCGKFDGPRQVECRAMADNACARPGTSS